MLQTAILTAWAAFFGGGMVVLLAQGGPAPALDSTASPPGVSPSIWLMGTLGTGFFAVCHAYITSNAREEKRQREEAQREARETDEALKAMSRDRDLWMRRAVTLGYKFGDEVLVHKEPHP